jgi:hypothetical protein
MDEERLISAFVWHTDWIHFIDWIGSDHLAFLSQTDQLAVEIVDLQGTPQQTFSLDGLGLTIPTTPFAEHPYDIYFLLWTALSQELNLVLYLRSGNAGLTTFRVLDLRSQREYFRLSEDDAFLLAPGIHQRDLGVIRPVWSPLGDQLALVLPSTLDSVFNLHLLSPGGILRQLTFFHLMGDIENTRVANPVWSPDGNFIAFWLITGGNGIAYPSTLYIYDLQQGSLTETTLHYLGNPNIVWSPYGSYLAFADSYEAELVIVDVNGCEVFRQSTDLNSEGGFSQLYNWFEIVG